MASKVRQLLKRLNKLANEAEVERLPDLPPNRGALATQDESSTPVTGAITGPQTRRDFLKRAGQAASTLSNLSTLMDFADAVAPRTAAQEVPSMISFESPADKKAFLQHILDFMPEGTEYDGHHAGNIWLEVQEEMAKTAGADGEPMTKEGVQQFIQDFVEAYNSHPDNENYEIFDFLDALEEGSADEVPPPSYNKYAGVAEGPSSDSFEESWATYMTTGDYKKDSGYEDLMEYFMSLEED